MLENALDYEGLRYYDEKVKNYIDIEHQDIIDELNEKIDETNVSAQAIGSPLLLTDSTAGNIVNFKGYGKSKQKQYSGKNELKCSDLTTKTINGVTFTPVYDNDENLLYVNVNGTATALCEYKIASNVEVLANEQILSGCPSGGSTSTYELQLYSSAQGGAIARDFGSGKVTTISGTATTYILVRSGVAVSNLRFYPMISKEGGEYEPYVGGTSSPNPSYEQRINAVGDKGWFDGELLQGYYNTSTGELVSNVSYVCNKNKIPCTANDEIHLLYGDTANALGLYFFSKDGSYISQVVNNSASEVTATAPTNTGYCTFIVNETVISPTTAKHICVTINGMYALIVKEGNKNLLNVPSSITLSASGYVFVNKPVSLKANKTYTFSFVSSVTQGPQTQFVINYSDGTSQSLPTLSTTAGQKTTQTFTPTKDVISATYYSANAMTVTECMIEEGAIATDYVEHESKTTYIPISQPLRSSLDKTVTDEVYKVDGKYIVERKFVERIVTNTNAILHSTSYLYISSGSSWVSDFKKGSRNVMSEYYRNNGTFSIVEGNIFNDSSGNLIICDTRFASADEAKTWFDENPMRLIAQLATPTIEVLDQAPFYEMRTFDEVTHIECEAEIEVEYFRDTENGQVVADVYSSGCNILAPTTKAYVTGTTTATTNVGSQVFDTGVYLGDTPGELVATTFKGDLEGNAKTATNATSATNASTATTLSGLTATVAELNYVDGVTSNIQTQLDGKAATSHGTHVPSACTTITDWNSATTTGWYMGNSATNAPTNGVWYMGYVVAHTANYVYQEIYQFTASTDAKAISKYIRAKMNGTWGAWVDVTVQKKVPSDAVFTDTNTTYTLSTITGTLAVSKGGTGATTLASGQALIGNGTGAVTTRAICAKTAVGSLDYSTTNANYLVDLSALAYWDGRYGNNSNLTYCKHGAFGAAATKGVDTAATNGSANLITSGAMYTALAGKANSSHTHDTVKGIYTTSGGQQAPSYIAGGTVRFNMWNAFKGLTAPWGSGGYIDCLLMDCYTGSDVPYVTAFGILKASGNPRAFLAVGAKGNTTTWASQTEIITSANIGSQTVATAGTCTGNAATATTLSSTLAISKGGTGATTAAGAIQNLNPTAFATPAYIFTMGSSGYTGGGGYTTIAQLKTTLGLGSAAYTASTAYAAASHGNHVPTTQTANNAVFLRNDNTWATVTPANIGAATSDHTHSGYSASTHRHTSESISPSSIELTPSTSTTNGGFIDFHYAGSTADYTSRIIESASGTLQISGKLAMGSNIVMPNNVTIQGKNTSGSTLALVYVNNYNNVMVGSSSAATYVDGNSASGVTLRTNGNAVCAAVMYTTKPVLRPSSTGTGAANLGNETYRWLTVYTQNAVSVSSDRRLKANIEDITDKYIKLWDYLKVKKFTLVNMQDGKLRIGYIAQEVEEAMEKAGLTLQECAFIHKDWVDRSQAEGSDNYVGYEYALDYDALATLTTAKVKQLTKKIDDYESRIASLEAKLQMIG